MTASYEKTIHVSEGDLDELRHVNNVRYVQWVQDVAKEHWKSLVSMEMQQQVVWVLLRHHIHYKNAAILDDAITIKTHVAHSRGAKSTRIVKMFNTHTQKPLIHSETEWCLLDAVTKRPIRIPEEIMWAFSK